MTVVQAIKFQISINVYQIKCLHSIKLMLLDFINRLVCVKKFKYYKKIPQR